MVIYYALAIYFGILSVYLLKNIFDKDKGIQKDLQDVKNAIQQQNLKSQDQMQKLSSTVNQIKTSFQQLTAMQDEFQKNLIITQTKLMSHVGKTSAKGSSVHSNSFQNSVN
ncbi:hypothetical protein pb186bvf_009379 [Paramecium bursaria]